MTADRLSRRGFIAGMAASVYLARPAGAAEPVELAWEDLIPKDGEAPRPALRGVIQHDDASLASQQPVSHGVRTEWNGKIVRIPGFVVPIKHSGTGVVAFILVPYVGACIHVPPPPANQLVLVTTERPYEVSDLFEPVRVTGVLDAAPATTELAEIGYTLSATRIEAYRQ